MKKVVCPACGLVNLEKFVTFPHCAACGAALTNARPERIGVWRRPVNALLWATVLGFCCAGLGVAGFLTAQETQHYEEKILVVYPQIPRNLRVGQVSRLRLGLDSIEGNMLADPTFQNLQLRLPLAVLDNFALVSIVPNPELKIARGNAVYFGFSRITRDQNISIALRPRRQGTHRVVFSLDAFKYSTYEWRGSIEVGPRVSDSAPKRAISRPARQTARPFPFQGASYVPKR